MGIIAHASIHVLHSDVSRSPAWNVILDRGILRNAREYENSVQKGLRHFNRQLSFFVATRPRGKERSQQSTLKTFRTFKRVVNPTLTRRVLCRMFSLRFHMPNEVQTADYVCRWVTYYSRRAIQFFVGSRSIWSNSCRHCINCRAIDISPIGSYLRDC